MEGCRGGGHRSGYGDGALSRACVRRLGGVRVVHRVVGRRLATDVSSESMLGLDGECFYGVALMGCVFFCSSYPCISLRAQPNTCGLRRKALSTNWAQSCPSNLPSYIKRWRERAATNGHSDHVPLHTFGTFSLQRRANRDGLWRKALAGIGRSLFQAICHPL